MSDISLSIIALRETSNYCQEKHFNVYLVKSVKFSPEKNVIGSALEKFPFRNVVKTRQIIRFRALAMREIK